MHTTPNTDSIVAALQAFVGSHTFVRLADLLSKEHPWGPEDVYGAIVSRQLYCDISSQDLATPSKCTVYVDQLTKELVDVAQASDGRLPIDTVNTIKPGDRITWNAGIYSIDRVERQEIILSSEKGKLLRVPIYRFNEILRDEIKIIHKDTNDFNKDVVLPPLTLEQKERLKSDIVRIRQALESDDPPPSEESRLRKAYFNIKKHGGLNSNIAALLAPKTYARGILTRKHRFMPKNAHVRLLKPD
jgi:hypothetical protein